MSSSVVEIFNNMPSVEKVKLINYMVHSLAESDIRIYDSENEDQYIDTITYNQDKDNFYVSFLEE